VPVIDYATSYVWNYTGMGTTITGGTTRNITIAFAANATGGDLTVYGINACGNGTVSAAYAITVNPLPAAAGTISGTATVCQGQSGVAYSVPVIDYATSYSWSYSGTGITITNGETRNITIDFDTDATSGTLAVKGVNSCGTGDSSTLSLTVNLIIGNPVFGMGDTSNRCQGAGSVTYPATAANTTDITYSLDGASVTGGNSMNITTGEVTYVAGWTGTSTITATANGCSGPTTATHTVIITPTVGTPVFTLGATSIRCQKEDTVTYEATATDATGISYSLDALSVAGGNTINTTTGEVIYVAGWSGTSVITANAEGCNGPVTATHTVTTNIATSILQQSSDTSICPGGTAVFTIHATGTNLTYQWSHDGVDIFGETTNQLIIDNADTLDAGIYRVAVESDCSATMFSDSIELFVVPANTSEITGNNNPLCRATEEIYSVELTSGSDYQWTVPAEAIIISDTTGINTNSITVDFGTISGPIRVIEVNSLGCIGEEKILDVALQGCELVADFTTDQTSICPGDSVEFTDASQGIGPGTIYFWDFGEGAIPSTASTQGPHRVVYATSGLKTIQLIITLGLSDTLVRDDYITVNEIPAVSIADADRCGEGDVIFTATPFDADIIEFSTDQGTSVAFTDNAAPYEYTHFIPANSTLSLWARAVNSVTGCSSTWDSTAFGTSHPLPLTPPILAADQGITEVGYTDVVCSGDTGVRYYINPVFGSTYDWSIPALGYIQQNSSEIKADWIIDNGDYTITVQEISSFGCAGTESNALVMVAKPESDLGNDAAICADQSITFSMVHEFRQYQWHDGSTEPAYTASLPGIVSVMVWDEYGCRGSDTVQLIVYPLPHVDLGPDTVICGNNSILLDAGDFALYQWSTGETTNPLEIFAGEQVLTVKVTDDNGCQDTDTIRILVCHPLQLLEPITNTFTPNGDKVHDTWQIKNIELFPNVSIKIFDRWGRMVYSVSKGYNNDWDGTSNGKQLPVDTYYYILDPHTGDEPINGTVTIVR
ncbi:MAG: gliding motility-associated C-terminal domain-containing protein, partial [Bacteroidales bacterium]|nr:gliding motility-associated C-terminal domain-containing protein [Bacteroidales bacterium]